MNIKKSFYFIYEYEMAHSGAGDRRTDHTVIVEADQRELNAKR